MLRKSILLILLLWICIDSNAQTVNWEFTTGGTGSESPIANMPYVCQDASGNIYHGGVFASPTIDVDPSGAATILNNNGNNDGYFAKYSSAGNFIWAIQIGGSSNDGVNGVSVDGVGNVYVTGYFNGTVDFDPSATVYNLTAVGPGQSITGDVFVAKYSPIGQLLWAFSYGSGTSFDYGWNVTVTPAGVVYVYGIMTMAGSIDIDPSAAVFNLNVANGNAYIAKYNPNGQFVNGINLGAAYQNSCVREVKLDNNIMYVGGYIKGNCDIDPSAGVKNITSTSEDPFIIKLDTNFNFFWGFNIPTSPTDEGFSISYDANNVYFSGYVAGSGIDFNPGNANTNLNSHGQEDFFIASYTKNGTYRWAKVMGGTGTDWSVCNVLQGRFVLITGLFHNTADFDPSFAGVQNMTSNGGGDGFCVKLDTNGFYQCKYQIGGVGEDLLHSIWFYAQNKMLINGVFSNTAHIPEPSGVLLLSQGNTDLFIADIDWACQACNVNYSISNSLTSCKTETFTAVNNGGDEAAQYLWNFGDGNTSLQQNPAHTYSTTGNFTVTLVVIDSLGCKDSTFKTINVRDFKYSLTDTAVACKTIKLTANKTSGNSATIFHWLFGDNQSDTTNPAIHQYASGGSYAVKLIMSDSTGCIDTINYGIFVDDVSSSFTVSKDTICQGDIITFTNSSSANTITYFYNFGDGDTASNINPNHSYINAGIYTPYLVVTNASGCHDTFSKIITVDSIAAVDFVTNGDNLCEGQQIVFNAQFYGGGSTGYDWSFGDGTVLTGKNPITHAFDTADIFNVGLTVHFRACPDASNAKNVTINPFPLINLGPDTGMCPGAVGFMLADVANMGNPDAQWRWNTGATSSSIFVGHPGIYTVNVSIKGCEANDSIEIYKDCYIDIPNVFSPNGDGNNDLFFPRNLFSKGLSSFEMKVYDRWGILMFETTKIDGRGWDGKYNGTDQPIGVYVYLINIETKNGDQEKYKGNVTLLR